MPAATALRALAPLLLTVLVGVAAAQEGADAPRTLNAASYQLFGVQDHALAATLQATETADGGARIVVSLPGATAADAYQAVLYHGDCGPDRPVALRLTPFHVDDDPLASVTEDEAWTFERLAESDLFVYLFGGPDIDLPDTAGIDGDVLACGEVGLDANR